MKVALIIPVLITGGAETMVARLALALKKQNVCVDVISMYPKQGSHLEKMIEDEEIKIHYIGKEGHGSKKAAIDLYKLLNFLKPDVVHSHIYSTFYAIPWIILHGGKLVHTIHTKPDQEFSKQNSNIIKFMTKISKMILVAVSAENQKLAMKYYDVGKNCVKYVNNPVEVNRYYHNDNSNKNIVYINVGRQDANKNQILMIRALKNVIKVIPNIKLVLVGNGTHHEMLKDEVKKLELGSYVSLLGERSDIPEIIADADVYLSTSHREGLPLSILEGMAAKLPVISTAVGGCSDIVRENGILIQDDDQKALEVAMIKLAQNEVMRKQMGIQSKKIALEYDADACAMKYRAIYQCACKKGEK